MSTLKMNYEKWIKLRKKFNQNNVLQKNSQIAVQVTVMWLLCSLIYVNLKSKPWDSWSVKVPSAIVIL